MKSLTQGPRRLGPGDLTEVITFQTEVRTADDMGGFTNVWSDAGQAWAKVEPLIVSERDDRGSVRSVTQYRFTVYLDAAAVSEEMRISWSGYVYNINGVRRLPGYNLFVEIIAESGVTQ